MTTTDILHPDAAKTEPIRDRFGRYLILPPDGKSGKAVGYTRATTIAKALDDTYNLEQWKLRTAAKGFAVRADLVARVATTSPDDKKTLGALCDDALAAGQADTGANFGTALHSAIERTNRGLPVQIPAPLDLDVAAYVETLAANKIEVLQHHVERVVVLDEYKIAGTYDMLVKLPSGEVAVADLKSSRDLSWSWPAIAVQLAIYAHADNEYDYSTGFRTPFPEDVSKTIGLVVHLPAGKAECTLHTIDIAEGWRALQLALDVRAWRKHRHLAHAYKPDLTIPAPAAARASIVRRIEALRAHDAAALTTLARLWPAHLPTLKQSDAHTVDDLAQIAHVLLAIETNSGVPF